MPLQFHPSKSSRHRIACIALYRALLQHVSKIPLPLDLPSQGRINPITHLVRKDFKRYRNHESKTVLVQVLQRGYEAEELLRKAATGEEQSLGMVHAHLWILHHQRALARTTCQPPPRPSPRLPRRVWPYVASSSSAPVPTVLGARPLASITGKRTVPSLNTGHAGVPFLRFKKEMSPFLSRVIKDKSVQRQRRLDLLDGFEVEGLWGADEERWDELVERGGETGKIGGGGSWSEEVEMAKRKVERDLKVQKKTWLETGRRMAEIVWQEKELAEKEKLVRNGDKERKRRIRFKMGSGKDGKQDTM